MFILRKQVLFLCFKFSTKLYFQQLSLSFDDLCKVPLISPKRTFPQLIILLFSVFQLLLDSFLYPYFNICGVMVIVVGYGHSDTSSNPGQS